MRTVPETVTEKGTEEETQKLLNKVATRRNIEPLVCH